jgi:hypothetical protein
MRKLEQHETPKTGDWSYHFGYGWIKLSNKPMPLKIMTVRESDENNKKPHFPIVIMRPNIIERVFCISPKTKPNQHRIRKTGSDL